MLSGWRFHVPGTIIDRWDTIKATMSEQNQNKESKPSSTENGRKGGKPKTPRFNFNFYWIYGIILAVLIISQVMTWGSGGTQNDLRKF
jgi:hypothetical protein